MLRTIKKHIALLSLIGSLAVSCSAQTVFVDTIADGSNYQLGRDLTRTLQVGYSSHPFSGDFTGVRPVFDYDTVNGKPLPVVSQGTSGAPCAEVFLNIGGQLQRDNGAYGSWIIQPFTPTSSGIADSLSVVLQLRATAGLNTSQGNGRDLYIGIIPAPTGLQLNPSMIWSHSVSIQNNTLGSIAQISGINVNLTAGQTYWLVLAPTNQAGVWNSNGLDYANVGWVSRSVAPDSSKVGDVLVNMYNGSGDFDAIDGRIIGFKLTGPEIQASTVANAKGLNDGQWVSLANTYISALTGAVGPDFFYIQQVNVPSGIRVEGATSEALGNKVTVVGKLKTLSNGERAIELSSISPDGGSFNVKPYGMNSKAIGGGTFGNIAGPTNGVGTNNVGLLSRIAGKVENSNPTNKTFNINDGGVIIKCIATGSTSVPANGNIASVTGVISLENGQAVLLVRGQSDMNFPL
ncbi:MAG: hypothetical protein SNJ70_05300 [Armatimonadota bacterium]